jgi:hypothetical protein
MEEYLKRLSVKFFSLWPKEAADKGAEEDETREQKKVKMINNRTHFKKDKGRLGKCAREAVSGDTSST